MAAARLRSLGSVLLATVGAAAAGVTSTVGAQMVLADLALLADEGWIMGGTGLPDPTVGDYISEIESLYLKPDPPLFQGQPTFEGYHFQGLTTPEQFCPFVCLPPPNPNLNFGQSLTQGVSNLNNAITPQLADGDNVAVFGYSQSATIASIEMQNLINDSPAGVDLSNLHVVLIGDPNNPIGGILDRFQFPDGVGPNFSSVPQHLPFVNIPLGTGATPTDTIPTDIYTGEYDGWANFPQDPLNILAVINALIGIETVHPYYPDPTAGVNLDVSNIIDLGQIGSTHFYDIPAPLPLLAWMYDGGPAGQFFYDMFAPGMALNINWAYGNPGDPFVGVNGTDAIGPWAVDASGHLVPSGVTGFIERMDPLQMLAGMQWAGAQSFIQPINDLLQDAGEAPLPQSFVDAMLAGYNFTNEVDQFLLNGWTELTDAFNVTDILGPDAIFDGSPLISGAPLLGLAGLGFDIFNLFGA